MKISQPEKSGLSSQRLTYINKFMERYVNAGKIAGFVTLVARNGNLVYMDKHGYQNLAGKKPIEINTIFRIYSMSKPITSVGFMMLLEKGLARLEDPVSKYIPEFKNATVYDEGGKLIDAVREISVHDLLRHTAGLSYGGIEETKLPVDELYDQADLFNFEIDLEEMVRRIAGLPLAYQPGSQWHYSVATDVVGRLIEIISDQPLPEYLKENVLDPLGMKDTSFQVPEDKIERFSLLYGKLGDDKLAVLPDVIGGDYFNVKLFLGGSGLVSTVSDYYRFAQLILNKGELNGVRLLGSRTVDYMTANHVPSALLPITMDNPWPGVGFGLGFSVMLDPPLTGMMGSPGLHGWGGWANTHFWVDQVEQMIGILMLQYIPSGTYPVTNDFRTAVYQALIEN